MVREPPGALVGLDVPDAADVEDVVVTTVAVWPGCDAALVVGTAEPGWDDDCSAVVLVDKLDVVDSGVVVEVATVAAVRTAALPDDPHPAIAAATATSPAVLFKRTVLSIFP